VKKSHALLGQRGALRDALLAEPHAIGPMTVLGEVWAVRRRGFAPSLPRQNTSRIAVTARAVGARGKAIADDTRHSDGRRRLATHLQAEGGAGG
jgi:hypothetical protein